MAIFNCLLSVTIIFLTLVQIGTSFHCYNCSEISDNRCKDPFKKDTPKIECSSGYACIKHLMPAIGLQLTGNSLDLKATIERGCKPNDYCHSVEKFSEYCSVCNADLCNSSSFITPSFTITTLLYLFKKIFV